MDAETISVRRDFATGRVELVGSWPARARVHEVLLHRSPHMRRRRPGRVEVRVFGGRAVYRILERRRGGELVCELEFTEDFLELEEVPA